MADWIEHGGPVESDEGPALPARRSPNVPGASRSRRLPIDPLEALANVSVRGLLLIWLGMVLGFGVAYWAGCILQHGALTSGGIPVKPTLEGLATALYFSSVTATSIGYGDVVPVGPIRVLAITEGAAGLLLFGCVISKLLSRRQEQLIGEIHRTTFEERLGRVRTNLHMVLSELQANAAMCSDPSVPPERVLPRVESAVMVFSGELRTIHDLLYRPQQVPEEPVLEAILASLAAAFRELGDLLGCLPEAQRRSAILQANLESISALAAGICGECVPRAYAPRLRAWMDRVQELSRNLSVT